MPNTRGSDLKLTKVRQQRASDSVFQILRACILDQTFLPGQRLHVHELAEKLDVSLTPVKDAITRLTVEGLIEIRPRSGTFVSQLSPQDIEETLNIRRALERLAAETVCANLTEDDIDWFEDTVTLLEKPVVSPRDRQQHETRNNALHLRLVELSGNKRLVETYNSLNAHIAIARIHASTDYHGQRLSQEREEHRRLLHALKERNTRALQEAIEEHIARAAVALVEDLKRGAAARKAD